MSHCKSLNLAWLIHSALACQTFWLKKMPKSSNCRSLKKPKRRYTWTMTMIHWKNQKSCSSKLMILSADQGTKMLLDSPHLSKTNQAMMSSSLLLMPMMTLMRRMNLQVVGTRKLKLHRKTSKTKWCKKNLSTQMKTLMLIMESRVKINKKSPSSKNKGRRILNLSKNAKMAICSRRY